ncbi:hypothetical protein CRUP_005899 [Coryphaenoides rupestris]|nr:hypothetical protein CRUP_005899 [Coryphaenoides rupestris]
MVMLESKSQDRAPYLADRRTATTTLTVDVLDGDDLGPMFLPCSLVGRTRLQEFVSRSFRIISTRTLGVEGWDKVNPVNVTPPIQAVDQDRNIQPPSDRPGILYSILIVFAVISHIFQQNNSDSTKNLFYMGINVQAEQDNGHPLPVFANLQIEVLDENNQAPYFLEVGYSGYVSEAMPVGATVASDPSLYLTLLQPLDRETRDTYTFQMTPLDVTPPRCPPACPRQPRCMLGTALQHQTVYRRVSRQGLLVLGKTLDRETRDHYTLVVTASDRHPSGAVDPDLGSSGQVFYRLVNHQNLFSINASGAISTSVPLDREAWDGGADPRRSRLTLSITVLDVDDNSPEFTQRAYVVDLPENSPKNTAILQLQVLDYERLDAVTVNIVVGLVLGMVVVVVVMGVVVVVVMVVVLVMAVVVVVMVVLDMNDFTPVFSQAVYRGMVAPNAVKGTIVTTVMANDSDNSSTPAGTVRYRVDQQAHPYSSSIFDVEETSGNVVTRVNLNEEPNLKFSLVVVAYDNGEPVKENRTLVEVTMLPQ